MLKLLKYLKPYRWLIIVLVALTFMQALANLQLPNYMAAIIDDGIIHQSMDTIYQNGGLMLVITLCGGAAAVGGGFLAARISAGFARDIRQKIFEKIESLSIAGFNKFSPASLITRTTNDIQQVQMATVMILRIALLAPIMAIGALLNAVQNAPSMSWIIAVAVAALLGAITIIFKAVIPKFKLLQTTTDKLNLVTRENLTGLRVVRAFNNEAIEEKKFKKANIDLLKLHQSINRIMMVLHPFMTLLMNLSLVAIVWFGAFMVQDGTVEIGSLMAFMQYAIQVITAFLMISFIFIMIPRASVSAKRIYEVLQTDPVVKEPEHPVAVPANAKGRLEFRNVTFSYPDADTPVLSNISFTAESGQTTALIGSTGSGKSTLVGLIPRFYDVSAGQILLDGVDVRSLRIKDLYSQIGFVPQKGVLFSGTVKSNVIYGNPEASDSDVRHALDIAQASEFVDRLDKGIDSSIAQGGDNVSGGQKQRLSIARALAVKPKLYVFDDAFSALDFKTDRAVRRALEEETKQKTVVIVGQRISSIMDADNIIVLNEGKIAGQGTHSELLSNNDVYQEIARSQLSDEELKQTGHSALGVHA